MKRAYRYIPILAAMAAMTVSCERAELADSGVDDESLIGYSIGSSSSELKSGLGAQSPAVASQPSAITLTSADGKYSLTLYRSVSRTVDEVVEGSDGSKSAPVTGFTIDSLYNDGSLQVLALKDNGTAYVPQQKLSFVRRESGSSVSRWKTDTDYRWPAENLTFWSWAPYSASAAAGRISDASVGEGELTFSYECPSTEGTVAEEQSDVLVACTTASSETKGNVSLMYKHALSGIRFQVDRANKCTIKSVSLSNVYSKGDCSFDGSSISWTGQSEPKTFTETFDTPIDEYLKDDYANPQALDKSEDGAKTFLLIPQSATNEKKVTMTLVVCLDGAEDITLSAELSPTGAIWEAGYTYTYSLSLGKSKIIYHWNDSGIPTHAKTHTGDAEVFEESDFLDSGENDITLHEPLWEPESDDDYYKFAGWAKSSTATEAEYVQKGRSESEGLPYRIDLHSEVLDLYAVWQKVEHSGAWIDYQAYKMNAFPGFRFDHIDSWEFDKFIVFSSTVNSGHEKIGFPIHGLEIGKWYTITFSEDVTPHENAYNPRTGIWGNSVRGDSAQISPHSKSSMLSYTTDYNAAQPVIHVWTHTASDNLWGKSTHIPMSDQQTTFYATAETMWWIWDLSKIADKSQRQYHIGHSKIQKMEEPTGPAIDFRNATLHGYKFEAYSDTEGDDSYDYADDKGRSTYKVKSDFTGIEVKLWGRGSSLREKINIPLINLEPGATYKLSFVYKLEILYPSSGQEAVRKGHDFCFGVRPEKNVSTSTEGCNGTDGYSANIATSVNDCNDIPLEMTFTVPTNTTTMYFIWSLAGLSDEAFFHKVISNAKLEKK